MVDIDHGSDFGRMGRMSYQMGRRSHRNNKQLYDKNPKNFNSYYGNLDARLFDVRLFIGILFLTVVISYIVAALISNYIDLRFSYLFYPLIALGLISTILIARNTAKIDMDYVSSKGTWFSSEELQTMKEQRSKRKQYITRPDPKNCKNCGVGILPSASNCSECGVAFS